MSTSRESLPLRVGIVGTGFAASSHVDALARVPGVRLSGLVGSSPERAREAAERLGLDPSIVAPDLDAMLDQVDAVHNCTPNYLHAEVTTTALGAGVHVLSEKPLAMGGEEAARLVSTAGETGLVTGVCFTYRHFPMVQEARSAIAGGAVHLVHGSYLQDWLLLKGDWNWRVESDKAGSTRAMGDIGSHWVDTVQHVVGDRVVEVMADLGRLHEVRLRPRAEVETFGRSGEAPQVPVPVNTEDFGSVLLRFAGGARGAFVVSQVSPGRKNRLWFEVDTGMSAFAWDQEEPNHLWIGRRDGANADLPRDPDLLSASAARLVHYPAGHQEGWPDALRNLFVDFYAAVEARRRGETFDATLASFEQAEQVTRVIEAIAESHRTRAWAPVAADETETVTDTEVVR
jgi:predicted dehydrogenase